MTDSYYTIRIRVTDKMVTGFETSGNTPCLLADELRSAAVKFYQNK